MNATDLAALAADPKTLQELVPPETLVEARASRDDLRRLLQAKLEAGTNFLLALADFDRRRGWEQLGYANLFSFLRRELKLSRGGASFHLKATRLVLRFPEVIEPLRDGRLSTTSLVHVAKVLTPENCAEVLPHFFGCSSREALEVVADLDTLGRPVRGTLVTTLPTVSAASRLVAGQGPAGRDAVQSTEPGATAPADPRTEVRQTAGRVRRLHLTVPDTFLEKISAARDGLSNSLPGATTEQVLEAALDLLLEKQARRKSLVRRPRPPRAEAAKRVRAPDPRAVPAAVERAVRLRDGDRCQHPLDGGGVCGSTWRVQLHHVQPVALGGKATVEGLRCLCEPHHKRVTEEEMGVAAARGLRRGRRRRKPAARASETEEGRPEGQPSLHQQDDDEARRRPS